MRTILAGLVTLQILGASAAWMSQAQNPPLPDQAPEQYPGQHQHKEPPPGWFCLNGSKDPVHACSCKRMAVKDEHGCCTADVIEDPVCGAYCHPKACRCKVTCDTSEHGAHRP